MRARTKLSGRGRFYLLMVVGAVLVAVALTMVHHNVTAVTDAGVLPPVSTSAGSTSAVRNSAGSTSAASPTTATRAVLPTSVRGSAVPARSHQGGSSAPSHPVGPRLAATEDRPPSATSRTALLAGPVSPGRPTVLHLPTLGVDASVDPVDSVKGILQVPDDISRTGWWRHSAVPGSAVGSTVLDGHIDSAVAGKGALFHLAELNPGDPVSLTTTTGTVHYRVQARRVYVKEQGLPAELFDQKGPGRLVLISCGGPFDRSIRSYEDNIAVFATRTDTN